MLNLQGLLAKEVYEASSLASFPSVGAAARLYIADDTDRVYRWNTELGVYRLVGSGGTGGASDHGALTGLADDDHPQYLTQDRADVRYALQGSGGAGVTDHGILTGLGDDDHPQYFNQARGDVRYALIGHGHTAASGSVDGFMSAANFTKLAGIASGATANATDSQLRDRTTHTGSQAIGTVTGLQAALDGKRATGLIGLNELASGGASNGQVLKYDATSGQWLPGTDLVGSGGGGGGAVDSVFGRIGTVTAQSGDYSWAQIGSKPSTLAGFGISDGTPSSHIGAGGVAHAAVTSLVAGFMSSADKTKLDGIPSNASANSSDATLLARANHTGSQAISTVSGLQAALDAKHVNILFRDEGSALGAAGTVDTLNFTGVGVAATRAGNTVTVDISAASNDPTKAPIAPTAEDIPTGSPYTIVAGDIGKIKYGVDSSAQTINLPTGLPTPFAVQIAWPAGSGTITIDAGTGVNINGLGDGVNVVLAQTGGGVYLIKRGATENYLLVGAIGDLTVADVTDMSANGRSLVQAANYATMLTALGAQAADPTLTALAALTIAANSLSVGSGADAFTQTTFAANTFPGRSSTGNLVAKTASDDGFSLLAAANYAAMRTALGLTALATTTPGTNVATFLATPSSANLLAALTDETGTGAAVFATSPTLVTPLLGTPTSGNLSNCTADGTDEVGTRNVPINSQSAAYTAVLADRGKCIFHPSADTTARTYTIPANSSVAYAVGTVLMFENDIGAGALTIAITTDTMVLVGAAGTTGSRTLAAGGRATALKVSSTRWRISGTAELT